MSDIFILLLENIIAFGGVPTGSINAQLAATVAGITKSKMFSFIPVAIEATIGINVAVVARLLVNSVNSMIVIDIMKTIKYDGKYFNGKNKYQSHTAKQDV